jgi:nucleotide-binding universal stress UspA family protein
MSDPRTLLLHLDDNPARTAAKVRFMRQLAEAFGARAVAQYAATPFLLRYPLAAEAAAVAVGLVDDADRDARDAAQAAFEAARGGDGRIAWSPATCDASAFANRALYADLVVVGQRDAADAAASALPPDFVEDLVIDCGRPVLVLPHAGEPVPVPGRVMVAWKETREAARAVTAALPWLKRAREVVLCGFGAGSHESLQRLGDWLQTHGVATPRIDPAPDAQEAGERLLSRAADMGSELLVMGCYGHSRSREWALGGASRTVLRAMTIPVLMVH